MIGAMAAITTRLRFTNAVYVATSRPLLEVAKQEHYEVPELMRELHPAAPVPIMCGGEPFQIMLALIDEPSVEQYQRAEDLGITAVTCAPWMGAVAKLS